MKQQILNNIATLLANQIEMIEGGVYDNVCIERIKDIENIVEISFMLDDCLISREDARRYLNVSKDNFSVIIHRCLIRKQSDGNMFRVGDIRRIKADRHNK